MRRLALLLIATAAVVALLVTVRAFTGSTGTDRRAAVVPPTGPATGSTSPSTSTSSPPPPHYRTGTLLSRAHTDYGDVRLRVITAKGRISRIDVLDVPHANSVDRELSWPAVRTLTQEVLRVQTADV